MNITKRENMQIKTLPALNKALKIRVNNKRKISKVEKRSTFGRRKS